MIVCQETSSFLGEEDYSTYASREKIAVMFLRFVGVFFCEANWVFVKEVPRVCFVEMPSSCCDCLNANETVGAAKQVTCLYQRQEQDSDTNYAEQSSLQKRLATEFSNWASEKIQREAALSLSWNSCSEQMSNVGDHFPTANTSPAR